MVQRRRRLSVPSLLRPRTGAKLPALQLVSAPRAASWCVHAALPHWGVLASHAEPPCPCMATLACTGRHSCASSCASWLLSGGMFRLAAGQTRHVSGNGHQGSMPCHAVMQRRHAADVSGPAGSPFPCCANGTRAGMGVPTPPEPPPSAPSSWVHPLQLLLLQPALGLHHSLLSASLSAAVRHPPPGPGSSSALIACYPTPPLPPSHADTRQLPPPSSSPMKNVSTHLAHFAPLQGLHASLSTFSDRAQTHSQQPPSPWKLFSWPAAGPATQTLPKMAAVQHPFCACLLLSRAPWAAMFSQRWPPAAAAAAAALQSAGRL